VKTCNFTWTDRRFPEFCEAINIRVLSFSVRVDFRSAESFSIWSLRGGSLVTWYVVFSPVSELGEELFFLFLYCSRFLSPFWVEQRHTKKTKSSSLQIRIHQKYCLVWVFRICISLTIYVYDNMNVYPTDSFIVRMDMIGIIDKWSVQQYIKAILQVFIKCATIYSTVIKKSCNIVLERMCGSAKQSYYVFLHR
jgi:hypothetical protein